MEYRSDNELTPAQDEHADQALRTLLARYHQPTAVSPPPLLARQIVAQMPILPPAQAAVATQRRDRRRLLTTASTALVLVLLTALGAWGALANSSGPALLFGGTDTTLGYLVLVLTLSIKPLLGLLASLDIFTLAASAFVAAIAAWGWWYLARQAFIPIYAEVDS